MKYSLIIANLILFVILHISCQHFDCKESGLSNLCDGAPCIPQPGFDYMCRSGNCDDTTRVCVPYVPGTTDEPDIPEIVVNIVEESSSGIPWWGILIICVGFVILVLLVILVVVKCILPRTNQGKTPVTITDERESFVSR